MENVVSVVSAVFWGLIVLSILVFLHEGGHFLAARVCGVRVREFFLGLPSRFRFSFASKRIGTTFGVTPILLGGYAAISGMEPEDAALAPRVLAFIHAKGQADIEELAEALACTEDEALEACLSLTNWCSIAPIYDEAAGIVPGGKLLPLKYAALARDRAGNTMFDGRAYTRTEANNEGEPWLYECSDEELYEQERRRTYAGVGFWRRALMLLAGIAVNLITGIIFLVLAYSVFGFSVPQNENLIGAIQAQSPAEKAGLQAHDRILSINDTPTNTWEDLVKALQHESVDTDIRIRYERAGAKSDTTAQLGQDRRLGIEASYATLRLNPIDSVVFGTKLLIQTAQHVIQLIQPQHTLQVLEQSSSIVGISAMSAQAAALGPAALLQFMALISFSLGFMNLLPIPPLDGGKLVFEIIQAVSGRTISLRVQSIVSYVGIGVFALLFVYMLRSDILRFFG
ncbi:site-2 protease family protein [Collinsella sp. zg1085]|uniref:M50 family metallopeptidase n=1 Tax=Collinsella sp. zg1085 TaxID=2844380 RepID=UPI001C0E3B8D|nr:site-2 protease family protein [Collinsella sp. zg1085]QWT17030.1 site-2 protease family protein [Collinsella sp. zg1085]